jgi:hypothetical protein
MRGREKEEIHYYDQKETAGKPLRDVVSVSQLSSEKDVS